jgi:leucyl aminopeptidase
MNFSVISGPPEKRVSACVVAAVYANRRLSPAAKRIDEASKGYISKLMKRGDLEGRLGQTLLLQQVPGCAAERVLLIGSGPEDEITDGKFRELQAKALSVLNDTGAAEAAIYLPELAIAKRDLHWKLRQLVEVSEDTSYRFDQLKSKKDPAARALKSLAFCVEKPTDVKSGQRAIREGQAIAKAVKIAKDLANLPGNHCTPTHLAARARDLQKSQRAIKVQVLEEARMKQLGMGALLAVASGSQQPAKLIILEYRGARPTAAPIALVGKGVTFDSGGISIKPSANMDEMKFDMAGAASVLGVVSAAAELKLPVNVIGLVPATENMPGGKAIKPGDVVTSHSGQTIEILNTDAEGRLILCDALTYAERFKPAAVIDIATLTGACVIALGAHASGLLGNDDGLVNDLLAAGNYSGDRAWQLPLWEEYQKSLDSPFADMANVGGREAGTITAACFLSRYTKKFKWAHLDIAGTAWRTGNKKGATGRPVPLLMQFLLDRAAKQ